MNVGRTRRLPLIARIESDARSIMSLMTSRLLAVSGKMAAGKDTISEPVAANLWPSTTIRKAAFADALRTEVNKIIEILRLPMSDGAQQAMIVQQMDCDYKQAMMIHGILWKAAHVDSGLTAVDHTTEMRRALQYWGTDVRRAYEDNYWVWKMRRTLDSLLSAGETVVVTDARFPNELDLIHSLNGLILRLDVDRDTQKQRLLARDGAYDESRLSHVSETAADDYRGFDARVSVDSKTVEQVVAESVRVLTPSL